MNYSYYLFAAYSLLFLSSCGKKTEETSPVRQDIIETVFASGVLEAEDLYQLTASTEGYLLSMTIDEGDLLKAGTVVAIIENKESSVQTQSAAELLKIAENNTLPSAPLLQQAKKNMEIAKLKMDQDAVQEQRYRRLWEANSIAKVEYENILLQYQNSKTNYESTLEAYKNQEQTAHQQVINNRATTRVNEILQSKNQIRTLLAGKVYKKYKQTGDYVRRGDLLAEIGSADKLYAKVNVDESNIARIKIGQYADVQLNTQKGTSHAAKVREILPSFDTESQSFICKLYFEQPLDFHIIRTQLQANIIIDTVPEAILIPRNYIDLQDQVQVKGEKNKRKLKVGFRSNEWVQVYDGIDTSTILVTEDLRSNNTKTSETGASLIH
jgi:HlyD family secretion protein